MIKLYDCLWTVVVIGFDFCMVDTAGQIRQVATFDVNAGATSASNHDVDSYGLLFFDGSHTNLLSNTIWIALMNFSINGAPSLHNQRRPSARC